jgi:hypothetical protein
MRIFWEAVERSSSHPSKIAKDKPGIAEDETDEDVVTMAIGATVIWQPL